MTENEKRQAALKAIEAGYTFWKGHPSMPSQSAHDLALCVKIELDKAGLTITNKRKKKEKIDSSFNSLCFPSE